MTFAELYNYDIEFYEYGWHPEDELEVIELGDRVSDHLTQEMFNTAFGAENDRIFGMIAAMVSRVASVTSWIGKKYPVAWYPKALPIGAAFTARDEK